MKFEAQEIPGVMLIRPTPFVDNRGLLRRHFCQKEFAQAGVFCDVRQTNLSENTKAFTLRGFHFQYRPSAEAKILSCMKGSFYDIVVDLRPDSPTYRKWLSFEINDENRLSIVVPEGCANAWITLQDDTRIFYYHSEFYSPNNEGWLRYDDPAFGFTWPREPAVISSKDKEYPNFDFLSHEKKWALGSQN